MSLQLFLWYMYYVGDRVCFRPITFYFPVLGTFLEQPIIIDVVENSENRV